MEDYLDYVDFYPLLMCAATILGSMTMCVLTILHSMATRKMLKELTRAS